MAQTKDIESFRRELNAFLHKRGGERALLNPRARSNWAQVVVAAVGVLVPVIARAGQKTVDKFLNADRETQIKMARHWSMFSPPLWAVMRSKKVANQVVEYLTSREGREAITAGAEVAGTVAVATFEAKKNVTRRDWDKERRRAITRGLRAEKRYSSAKPKKWKSVSREDFEESVKRPVMKWKRGEYKSVRSDEWSDVWVAVDEKGDALVNEKGRAEIRYSPEEEAKIYTAYTSNLRTRRSAPIEQLPSGRRATSGGRAGQRKFAQPPGWAKKNARRGWGYSRPPEEMGFMRSGIRPGAAKEARNRLYQARALGEYAGEQEWLHSKVQGKKQKHQAQRMDYIRKIEDAQKKLGELIREMEDEIMDSYPYEAADKVMKDARAEIYAVFNSARAAFINLKKGFKPYRSSRNPKARRNHHLIVGERVKYSDEGLWNYQMIRALPLSAGPTATRGTVVREKEVVRLDGKTVDGYVVAWDKVMHRGRDFGDGETWVADRDVVAVNSTTRKWPGNNYEGVDPR